MNPTEEQLKDPKWWDENAPEGAEVYIDGEWYKWEAGQELKFDTDRWHRLKVSWSFGTYVARGYKIYTRPIIAKSRGSRWSCFVGDLDIRILGEEGL